MSDELLAALAQVVLPFAQARTPPREVYTDPAWHARERALFADGFAAGGEADLPRPGAWTRVPLADASLVLLRGADGVVRALHDVCRHRGVQLLDGAAGQLAGAELACPYHGWCYGLGGELLRAPGLQDDGERAALGLRAARVWSRWGQLFVAPGDGPAPPRLPGPPWLDELARVPLRRARRVRWDVAANWKLLVENFQEAHHFPAVHPGLEARTPAREATSVAGDGRWLGGTMALQGGLETVSLSGERRGRPFVASPARRRSVHDAWVSPNLLTSLQPDYLLTYRLAPRAVDRTEVVGEIFVHAEAPDDAAALEDVAAFWDRTNAEDRAICERQQRGLADRGHPPHRYAAGEDGMHAFDAIWAARMLAALRPTEAR